MTEKLNPTITEHLQIVERDSNLPEVAVDQDASLAGSELTLKSTVKGHVKIVDKETGEVLLDKFNAVNNQNMAEVIARGLSNLVDGSISTHQIYALALGNGGSSVSATNEITFLPPNVSTSTARLYNATYCQPVDESIAGTPPTNSVTYQRSSTDNSSIVIVTMTIGAGQPPGQDSTDTPPDPNLNSQFSFDELGLFTYGSGFESLFTAGQAVGNPLTLPNASLLLTHIIFSPILKTANRELVLTYTLTVSVS